jgi:hypothetical protein
VDRSEAERAVRSVDASSQVAGSICDHVRATVFTIHNVRGARDLYKDDLVVSSKASGLAQGDWERPPRAGKLVKPGHLEEVKVITRSP